MRALKVVGAAIIKDGLCLAARRAAGGEHGGLWEFPGGKVDPGETPEEALVREIAEELDIVVAVEKYVGQQTSQSPTLTVELSVYACRWLSGELKLAEHAEISWLEGARLFSVNWAPADRVLAQAVALLLE